ncbi:MAG: Cof-type HAD-IIB family hydrolase [Spirochaetaceae bacterium]|nr:Cof-type HAD-IIB family hydrolase [Spirochaetaceae bacterium]MCF7948805.1 Cof-type HAD-IIB family hydrolase [Spirochaetia bacterium]MCF7950464.1 Cof-type HAD-IIB family hydrolase [Spirochaetaceae bacterium]
MKYRGMVVSDFDGTLYDKTNGFTNEDIKTLETLEKRNYVRVLATGRSLQSLYRAVDSSFPVDYVVFSSGAGVYELRREALLKRTVFSAHQTQQLCRRLIELEVDFMVHHPIPDNHYFHYYRGGEGQSDFLRRIELYKKYALDFEWRQVRNLEATQFVIITAPDQELLQKIQADFQQECSVIWSSSPLDASSLWIELFPIGAHKGSGSAWLADKVGVLQKDTMAVGNDFNDVHMLEWSGTGFVVANAPEELRRRFAEVAACGEGGFSEAVVRWLGTREWEE